MAVFADQRNHLDHLSCPALLPVPANQFGQKLVVALRPKSFFPPCGERFGSSQCARLSFQNIEVVLKVCNLLLMAITTLVLCDASSCFTDFHPAGMQPNFDCVSGFGGNR